MRIYTFCTVPSCAVLSGLIRSTMMYKLFTWVACQPLPSSCPGQPDRAAPNAELKASQLVEQLVDGAARHVRSFGATDVALVLDGLARLRIQPPAVLLDALAEQVSHPLGTSRDTHCLLNALHPVDELCFVAGGPPDDTNMMSLCHAGTQAREGAVCIPSSYHLVGICCAPLQPHSGCALCFGSQDRAAQQRHDRSGESPS